MITFETISGEISSLYAKSTLSELRDALVTLFNNINNFMEYKYVTMPWAWKKKTDIVNRVKPEITRLAKDFGEELLKKDTQIKKQNIIQTLSQNEMSDICKLIENTWSVVVYVTKGIEEKLEKERLEKEKPEKEDISRLKKEIEQGQLELKQTAWQVALVRETYALMSTSGSLDTVPEEKLLPSALKTTLIQMRSCSAKMFVYEFIKIVCDLFGNEVSRFKEPIECFIKKGTPKDKLVDFTRKIQDIFTAEQKKLAAFSNGPQAVAKEKVLKGVCAQTMKTLLARAQSLSDPAPFSAAEFSDLAIADCQELMKNFKFGSGIDISCCSTKEEKAAFMARELMKSVVANCTKVATEECSKTSLPAPRV